VESLLSNASELEKFLAEKTKQYEATVTQVRFEVEKLCQGNEEIARQLVEKKQECSTLINQVALSKHDFDVAFDERDKRIKSHEEQLSLKNGTTSQLKGNVQQLEQLLRESNADLHQKLAIITETGLND
jgi:predicted RNase H-like nuclease (RuvC/YqgF family)